MDQVVKMLFQICFLVFPHKGYMDKERFQHWKANIGVVADLSALCRKGLLVIAVVMVNASTLPVLHQLLSEITDLSVLGSLGF